MRLESGADLRHPETRREVFQRFYTFQLEHRAHPGAVYYLMPYLKRRLGWGEEEALWFAFLNGHTQNPVTTLQLFERSSDYRDTTALTQFFNDNASSLFFDMDRRHHKYKLLRAIEVYAGVVDEYGSQGAWAAPNLLQGWDKAWLTATSLYSFGRLSAFSYLEYLRIMGVAVTCEDLMLSDIEGSKSHRNGLCKVLGRDDLDWHASNPGFKGDYPEGWLPWLRLEAEDLLLEAEQRNRGQPWAGDVGYFTLESALCTFKSWFRKNRRYPNVYNDMLYDRLRQAEATWGRGATRVFWEARRECLPAELRLEDNPGDPGCVSVKQNWFLNTGQVPVMFAGTELESEFDRKVRYGEFGLRKERYKMVA